MQFVAIIAIVIVVFILLWLARYALQMFPQGEPVDRLASFVLIVLGVMVLIWAILAAVGAAPVPSFGRL